MHFLASLVLTLAQAVDYAVAHSATAATQRAAVAQAHAAYISQRSQSIPNVNGQLQNQMSKSANYNGSYSVIGAAQASVFSQNTASIGTSYTIDGGLSYLQTAAAKQQYEQAQADLRRVENTIATDVTNAFNMYAANTETVRLDQGDLQYQSVLVQIAKAKEHAGVAAGVDVLQAQANQEKSRYTLAAAKASSEDSRESLAQLIGAPLDTAFALPQQVAQPKLPARSVDELIALAQANRPEIASAQEGVRVAQINRRASDADLYPQIQTFAQFGNQFSPTLAVQQSLFGPVNRGSPGYWLLGVTSTVTLPFVDWGSRRAKHASLNEQIFSAETTLGSTRTQVELDVRQAYRGAETALAQIASAQQETRFATEAARIARLQYEHGLKSITDVFAAQQTSLSAQNDLYNARVSYVDAIVKLRVALGMFDPHAAVADL
jgi:outer membrane protein TolC